MHFKQKHNLRTILGALEILCQKQLKKANEEL